MKSTIEIEDKFSQEKTVSFDEMRKNNGLYESINDYEKDNYIFYVNHNDVVLFCIDNNDCCTISKDGDGWQNTRFKLTSRKISFTAEND